MLCNVKTFLSDFWALFPMNGLALRAEKAASTPIAVAGAAPEGPSCPINPLFGSLVDLEA